ncbi:MAG: DUF4010 domain-containing protein [Candidatus Nanoarchaeia archaeon]|jgi:uncharacterized membrane protein (DUF4010 family)
MVDSLLVLGQLVFSAALGGLVGIEREFGRRVKKSIPIGVRTMIFISLLGTLTMVLQEWVSSPWLVVIGLVGLIILSAISYHERCEDSGERGLTTYAAAFITYLVGVLIGLNEFLIAVIIAVIITTILSLSHELHSFAEALSREEWRSTIIMAIISLVILPLLPDTAIDPFGIFNPFRFWLMVVIITGLSFISYILMRLSNKGLSMTGLLGGFLSSKVTAYQLTQKAKNNPELRTQAFNGVLLAVSASIITNVFIAIIGTFDFNILSELIIPLLVITAVILIAFIKGDGAGKDFELTIKNPLNFFNALKIALLIFLFSEGAYLLSSFVHPSLIYPVIMFSSMVSSTAAIASIVSLFVGGSISGGLATNLFIFASAIGIIDKIVFVKMGGDRELFKRLLLPLMLWPTMIIVYLIIRNYLLPI